MSRIAEILNILQNGPMAISEILSALGEQISKATLKRDLLKLLEQKQILKKGNAKSTRYELSKSVLLLNQINVEKYFQENLYTRKIKEKFDSEIILTLKKSKGILFTDQEKEHILNLNRSFRSKRDELKKTILKKEYERLCVELAWKSSSIEGNTYSILETESLIKTGREAKGHSKEEAVMILNHKEALENILDKPEHFLEIDSTKICEVHKTLTKNLYIDESIRSQLIGISGTAYKPPASQFKIEKYLEEIAAVINSMEEPFEKALISLSMLAYLQAFEDGNKRTSRMITNSILIAHDFCPLSFASIDETEYKKALVLFYEQNNLHELKRLFIEQFEFAVNNYF